VACHVDNARIYWHYVVAQTLVGLVLVHGFRASWGIMSAATLAASVGDHDSRAGPSQGANCAPLYADDSHLEAAP